MTIADAARNTTDWAIIAAVITIAVPSLIAGLIIGRVRHNHVCDHGRTKRMLHRADELIRRGERWKAVA